MIKVRNAICCNCGGMMSMKNRYSYKDISVQLMNGSTDKGAEKAYNTALARFTAQLAADHVIRVMDIKLEKVTRRKRKSPPQPTGIRQTATAHGARFILILRRSEFVSSGWQSGTQPRVTSMRGK